MNFKLFEKTDVPLSVTISRTLLKRINAVAERERVNKSSVVRVLLEKGLESYESRLKE